MINLNSAVFLNLLTSWPVSRSVFSFSCSSDNFPIINSYPCSYDSCIKRSPCLKHELPDGVFLKTDSVLECLEALINLLVEVADVLFSLKKNTAIEFFYHLSGIGNVWMQFWRKSNNGLSLLTQRQKWNLEWI